MEIREEARVRKMMLATGVALTIGTFLFACGGGSSSPSSLSAPLTLAEAAPTMAQTGASVLVAALEGPGSVLTLTSTGASFSRQAAQASPNTTDGPIGFIKTCPTGGSVRLTGVVATGGRYSMTSASATFTACGFNPGRRAATMNGTLTINGAWCPGQSSCTGPTVTQPDMPVRTTGCLDVSDIGCVPFTGSIGLGAYALSLGGVGVLQGKPDTPPPPNPNSCPATLSATSFSAGSSGGTFGVTVIVGSTCPWTAASNSGFIAVTSGASGNGNGTVTFSVAANTGAARTGSLSIAGQTVTVSQAAPAPTIGSFSASQTTVAVGQSSTLAWTGITNASTCLINNGVGSVSCSDGSASASPTATTTYTLTATGSGGSATAVATVIVTSGSSGTFTGSPIPVTQMGTLNSGVGCMFAVTQSGTFSAQITSNADGTVGGTTAGTSNVVGTVVPGSLVGCTGGTFATALAGSVSGTNSAVIAVAAGSHDSFTFNGVRTGNVITGSLTITTTLSAGITQTFSKVISGYTLTKQ